MKIENIEVYGFRRALHGMRNPMDSWGESDSVFTGAADCFVGITAMEGPFIGLRDQGLARKLIMRGSEHRKFLRQIMIWMDITIPRYVWQELDTYKVATVRASCSTMNKLGSRDLCQTDFELPISELTLEHINQLARLLREAKEEHEGVRETRRQLKNELSEGYLQKATYSMSYETALGVLLQRGNHRLPEWRLDTLGSICDTLISLPYMRHFYEAATWKKSVRRHVVSALSGMLSPDSAPPASDAETITIRREVLEDLVNQLRAVV